MVYHAAIITSLAIACDFFRATRLAAACLTFGVKFPAMTGHSFNERKAR
jgi:hypothetical protein